MTRSFASKARRVPATLSAQRGIALLVVLWLSIMLTVIASGLAFDTRGEVLAARNTVSLAQAKARADGAVHLAVYRLVNTQRLPESPDRWLPDGAVHEWQEGDASLTVSAWDESGRIDLNAAPEALLRSLFMVVGEATESQAGAIVAAIVDWRDADDLARPNGAEQPEYRAAGRKYRPANQPFESVEELRRVLGVTEALFSRVAGSLTVYSRLPGVYSPVASREVLLSIPGASPEAVDSYLETRRVALSQGQPVPPFAQAVAYNAAPSQVWRVRADVATRDGARFAREAVVRATPSPAAQLPSFLLWREGA